MIGIVDYGMGNLRSVSRAVAHLGERAVISGEKRELDGCPKLILPGVGSFAAGMENLRRLGLDVYLKERLQDTPMLGICLGMQFLLEESEEEGPCAGLSVVRGRAVRFCEGKVPQIGWNSVDGMRTVLFRDIPNGEQFYFVHSYYADTTDEFAIGTTEYYTKYASAVHAGNAYGVQFHPEKSGEAGLRLLDNFLHVI